MTEEIVGYINVDGSGQDNWAALIEAPTRCPHRATLGFALIAALAGLLIVPLGRAVRFLRWLSREWGREALGLALIAWALLLVAVAWIVPEIGR